MDLNAPPAALPEGLRGDYAAARPDFTVAQDMAAYTEADHATWRTLYARQAECLRERAATAYLESLDRLPFRDGVPDFAAVGAAQLHCDNGSERDALVRRAEEDVKLDLGVDDGCCEGRAERVEQRARIEPARIEKVRGGPPRLEREGAEEQGRGG